MTYDLRRVAVSIIVAVAVAATALVVAFRLRSDDDVRHSVLAEHATDMVPTHSPDGRFAYATQSWAQFTGASPRNAHRAAPDRSGAPGRRSAPRHQPRAGFASPG